MLQLKVRDLPCPNAMLSGACATHGNRFPNQSILELPDILNLSWFFRIKKHQEMEVSIADVPENGRRKDIQLLQIDLGRLYDLW